MASSKHLSAPLPTPKMPPSVPYILTNEAAERFAFYGMSSILVIFMTKNLMGPGGVLNVMGDESAREWFHWFTAAVYFMAIVGAVISDVWFGKFKTIIWFALVYCVGFFILTFEHTRLGLAAGLILIATGSGIIKPCVSANVGDQFGPSNKHLIQKMYSWFYFSINVGAAVSMWWCPILLEEHGPTVGFGVPAFFMVIATLAYWLGRRKMVDIPPAGPKAWMGMFDREQRGNLAKIGLIFVFVAMFFALYYQSQSAWVLQAEKMNLHWLGITWLPAQMQAANSLLVVVMIPLFAYVVYPAINRVWTMTSLRKIGIGMIVTALSFAIPIWVENRLSGGDIFKCSSQSVISGLEAVHLIDGLPDGSGWSSDAAPMDRDPVEIVIRLRERRAWEISSVEIDAGTILTEKEILAFLDARLLALRKQAGETTESAIVKELNDKISRLKTALRDAKAAAGKARDEASDPDKAVAAAQAARTIAVQAMQEIGEVTRDLDEATYRPKEVAVFAGNFSGRMVPKLFSAMSEDERADANSISYYEKAGWHYVGDCTFTDDATVEQLKFKPVEATHVLIQVKSDQGASRVKIGEIRVLTDAPVTATHEATAQQIWPNVAAIGYMPSIGWQFLAYIFLTAAEIMVSVTALEFAYTQAPNKMKSLIQAINLLSISLGNIIAAVVNMVISNPDGTTKLPGASYYWFFAIAMLITAFLFIPVALWYKPRDHIQEAAPTV